MTRTFILSLLLVPIASTAGAQRHCKKGIPCGGTCISATKTCHVGVEKPTEPDTTLHRVKLSEDEKIYFSSEEEAQTKGYRRSKARGC